MCNRNAVAMDFLNAAVLFPVDFSTFVGQVRY